jgi:FkbH-like protein
MHSESDRRELRERIKDAVGRQDAAAVVELGRQLVSGTSKAADVMFCSSSFAGVADAIQSRTGARRLKTYVVRSVTVEPILPFLAVEVVLAGYVLDVEVGGFGSYMDEMLDPESSLGRSGAELVLVLLDIEDICGRLPELCADGLGAGVEAELAESVSRVGQMLRSYRAGNAGRIVLQGCVVPESTSLGQVADGNLKHGLVNAVKDLNRRLLELCKTVSDCVFFDVDEATARYGRASWRDTRLFLASRLPISSGAFQTYARGLIRTASVLFRAPRKVLCTDLDNTLWGGVLGEDGPQGIVTGSAFPGNCYLEYQRYLKQLSARGILLALVSKNNEADVEEAFQVRAADLAVRLDSFVAKKIGWNEKAEALRALAEELSLGLDSFVFVDDSPVECAAIRRYLPEVAVVEVPVDRPWELVGMLAEEWFFDSAAVTADDVNRSKEYEAQAQRNALRDAASSRDEFLQSLGIVCTFVSALDAPLARTVQLLAKTNQFNLTTRRHSAAEVERFAGEPGGQAIAVRVSDRFGDAGVVGVALATQQGDQCLIDSLLLSCRVIGRGIETALLSMVAKKAASMGARWLIGEYIKSSKNAPCADFYSRHGFERDATDGDAGSVFYRLDLTERMPTSPSWLTLEGD